MNRPGLVADSEAVILSCASAGHPMFIAWHGLATAYYLLKRVRTEAEAMLEVDKILSWAQVADASDTKARAARALGFGDFEDALQAVSAEACAAHCIVTRNTTDFAKSMIPVFTPQEFMQRFPTV
jgi:predicted nucleic acid-binding protein